MSESEEVTYIDSHEWIERVRRYSSDDEHQKEFIEKHRKKRLEQEKLAFKEYRKEQREKRLRGRKRVEAKRRNERLKREARLLEIARREQPTEGDKIWRRAYLCGYDLFTTHDIEIHGDFDYLFPSDEENMISIARCAQIGWKHPIRKRRLKVFKDE